MTKAKSKENIPDKTIEENPQDAILPIKNKYRAPKNGMKAGRLSFEEREFIRENSKTMTDEDMALKLNRRVETIKPFRERTFSPVSSTKEMSVLDELHVRPYWREIHEQFNKRELEQFEAYWVSFYEQFGSDVEFSEQLQIVALIKVNLLVERNLKERNTAKKEVEKLEDKLQKFKEDNKDCLDEPDINMQKQILDQQINFARTSYLSRTGEFKTLSDKQDNYMKELKATRAQRIEQIKNRKKDFVQLIRDLMDEEVRAREGREIALINLSAELEKKKLGEFHIYNDGVGDKPLLNCDTVGEDNEQNKDSQ